MFAFAIYPSTFSEDPDWFFRIQAKSGHDHISLVFPDISPPPPLSLVIRLNFVTQTTFCYGNSPTFYFESRPTEPKQFEFDIRLFHDWFSARRVITSEFLCTPTGPALPVTRLFWLASRIAHFITDFMRHSGQWVPFQEIFVNVDVVDQITRYMDVQDEPLDRNILQESFGIIRYYYVQDEDLNRNNVSSEDEHEQDEDSEDEHGQDEDFNQNILQESLIEDEHMQDEDLNRIIQESIEDTELSACPAPQALSESLVTEVLHDQNEAMTCMICLEECVAGTEVKRLPCSHRFHGDCIDSWFARKDSCPLCRFTLAAQR